jgi:hypothetical protein
MVNGFLYFFKKSICSKFRSVLSFNHLKSETRTARGLFKSLFFILYILLYSFISDIGQAIQKQVSVGIICIIII